MRTRSTGRARGARSPSSTPHPPDGTLDGHVTREGPRPHHRARLTLAAARGAAAAAGLAAGCAEVDPPEVGSSSVPITGGVLDSADDGVVEILIPAGLCAGTTSTARSAVGSATRAATTSTASRACACQPPTPRASSSARPHATRRVRSTFVRRRSAHASTARRASRSAPSATRLPRRRGRGALRGHDECRSGLCDTENQILAEPCAGDSPECAEPCSCENVSGRQACTIRGDGGCVAARPTAVRGKRPEAALLVAFCALAVALGRPRRARPAVNGRPCADVSSG